MTWFRIYPRLLQIPTLIFFTPPYCPSLMSQRERAKERGEKAEKNVREGVRGVA